MSCASGHILHGTAKPLGVFSNWKLLATLPAAVNCMCSTVALWLQFQSSPLEDALHRHAAASEMD